MPGLLSWKEMVLRLWIVLLFWSGLVCLGVLGEPRGAVNDQDILANEVSMGKILSLAQKSGLKFNFLEPLLSNNDADSAPAWVMVTVGKCRKKGWLKVSKADCIGLFLDPTFTSLYQHRDTASKFYLIG
jgi:hypothetical protein